MTTIFYRSMITDGQCGIGRIFSTHTVDTYNKTCNGSYTEEELKDRFYTLDKPVDVSRHNGGTSFFGTGFIAELRCKETYDKLCAMHPLVFQTPVRKNSNTGKMFFYAMWDTTKQTDVQYIQPNWPFDGELF
jgi:hypothetical protein